jgi:ubiquinone/menaquinone biosynthesis C-methylase UbiE
VRGIFRVWSSVYDHPVFQSSFYRRVHAVLMQHVERTSKPARVLDLGCGTGQLTVDLAQRYPDALVMGGDMSADMLARGRHRGAEVPFVQANVYGLPFADGSLDLITNTISYHWYLDHRRALSEVARVLAPGGHFIMATLSTPLFGLPIARQPWTLSRQRVAPPNAIAAELEGAGLTIEARDTVFPIVRIFTASRPRR